jgi:hypothetical protein
MASSVFQLARQGATQSKSDYLQKTADGLSRASRQVERTTYQGYEPTTGLLYRRSLGGDKSVADGIKVFNRHIDIGEPLLAIPTGDRTRLLARYQRQDRDAGDREILRKSRLLKSPQAITWMAINATLGGNFFELPFSFIPTYAAYVGAPFATPANFTLFSTIRDFNDLGEQIRLNVGGGTAQTISGIVNTSDTAFSANYSTRTFGFAFKVFREQPGSLDIEVTIEQDDGSGGISSTNTIGLVGSTALRQPNGLYVVEVDQTDVPSPWLTINSVAKNVTVSLSYGE